MYLSDNFRKNIGFFIFWTIGLNVCAAAENAMAMIRNSAAVGTSLQESNIFDLHVRLKFLLRGRLVWQERNLGRSLLLVRGQQVRSKISPSLVSKCRFWRKHWDFF